MNISIINSLFRNDIVSLSGCAYDFFIHLYLSIGVRPVVVRGWNAFTNLRTNIENIFDDFLHPNPNINTKACLDMIRYWPEVSMPRLISNLKEPDIVLRRKSIKALGYFGDIALEPVVNYFFDNSELIVRVSCLKVLIKINITKLIGIIYF